LLRKETKSFRNQTGEHRAAVTGTTVSIYITISFKRVFPSLVSLMSPAPPTSLRITDQRESYTTSTSIHEAMIYILQQPKRLAATA
jgi:hypothetical protein